MGIYGRTLISRIGHKYALKGNLFRKIVKLLICINKQLVLELAQLLLIFHNNSFQNRIKTKRKTF